MAESSIEWTDAATGADMMRARDEGAFPVTASPLLKLAGRKGGDPQFWPAGDWPREWPEAR